MNKQSEQALRASETEAMWETVHQALHPTNLLSPSELQASLDNWSSKIDVQSIQNARALDATEWISQRKAGTSFSSLNVQAGPQWQNQTRQT